jgi:TolA-binding protein
VAPTVAPLAKRPPSGTALANIETPAEVLRPLQGKPEVIQQQQQQQQQKKKNNHHQQQQQQQQQQSKQPGVDGKAQQKTLVEQKQQLQEDDAKEWGPRDRPLEGDPIMRMAREAVPLVAKFVSLQESLLYRRGSEHQLRGEMEAELRRLEVRRPLALESSTSCNPR